MTNMADPATVEDYNSRFKDSYRVSGTGFQTTVHFPCPFCAAPDWMVVPLLAFEDRSQQEHVCKECQRGAKHLVHRERESVSVTMTLVQTKGADIPAYLPKIERAS
jgi:hypothetical protein